MSRKLAFAATVALAALAAVPMAAAAQDDAPAAAPTAQPASAAERATYARTDALTRSVFWNHQLQINPADAEAGLGLADALRELGQFDQSAAAAQQVLLAHPNNIDAMLAAGRAHIARGQGFYAIAPLEQAKAAAPRDWRPLSLLGVAYEQVQRTQDARQIWTEALALSPDNPAVLSNMAMAMAAAGQAVEAEQLLRRAAAQPTATIQVRQNLALVLGLQGKTAEAEQIIRRDLPPEQAEQNLAWLRRQTTASQPAATAGGARTWESLQGG